MKKTFTLLLAAALALSLAACGSSGTGSSTTSSGGSNGTTSGTPSGGGEDDSAPPANPEPNNDAQALSFGDTVTTGHFEFTPVFEGFAEEVANWPDENYLTPDGTFYGSNPFKAGEEKTMMWFSGTVNFLDGATSNETFAYSYKVVYDGDYTFKPDNDNSGEGYTIDLASGEWERDAPMTFEPLSSKTMRYVRFCIEVPEQVETNTDKDLSLEFNVVNFDENGNDVERNTYIYKIR